MTVDDLFGALCAFEVFALASGRVPTITTLCRKRRLRAVAVAVLILAHLVQTIPTTQGAQ